MSETRPRTTRPIVGMENHFLDGSVPDLDLRVLRNLALFKLDLVEQDVRSYRAELEALDAVEVAMDGAAQAAERPAS